MSSSTRVKLSYISKGAKSFFCRSVLTVEEMLVATVSQPLRSAPPSEKLQCHDWDKDKVQSWLEEKEVPEE